MGSFTEPAWQFGAIAMNDDDGDGIWTATANISGAATFAYKFNNGAPVVEDVAVYDGEESWRLRGRRLRCRQRRGRIQPTHERSGVAETLDVVCFNSWHLFKRFRGRSGTQWQLYPGAGALGVGPIAGATLAGGQTTTATSRPVRVCSTTSMLSTRTVLSRTFSVTRHGWKAGRLALEKCVGCSCGPSRRFSRCVLVCCGLELTLDGVGSFRWTLAKVFNGGCRRQPCRRPSFNHLHD